jgi:hypothetical protein
MVGKPSLFLLVLAVAVTAVANCVRAADLSQYPCNVFNQDACFRLPAGTHVDYSIPADFHFFVVSKGSIPIATIYFGDAPQQPESGASRVEKKTSQGTLVVIKNKGAEEDSVDIYIFPRQSSRSAIHVSANLAMTTEAELRELLSSLRPCFAIKSGGQRCPKSNVWSKELANLYKAEDKAEDTQKVDSP